MIDLSNVTERLRSFILQHPEMSKSGFIQGLDKNTGKIIIIVNGQEKYITIDELESGHLNNNVQAPTPKEEMIEVMEEPVVSNQPTVNSQPVTNNQQKVVTLKDIDEAVKTKNEAFIDKALGNFAINNNTGVFDFGKLITGATDAGLKNIANSVGDGKDLPLDKSAYDAIGNLIVEQAKSQQNVDVEELIRKSFENIKVFVEVARLKNIAFTEKDINTAYTNYSNKVHKQLAAYGLEKNDNNVVNIQEYRDKKEEENNKNLSKKLPNPDVDIKKAGFADILVLTIIVVIYAAIIINLVSKLN